MIPLVFINAYDLFPGLFMHLRLREKTLPNAELHMWLTLCLNKLS
jgi:hypothetical protein